MKRLVLVLGILLMSMSASVPAYAGTINTYEQDVMTAAQGTFDYKGTPYKLDQSYISQLKDYLTADDVDLTADQRDTVLQSINGYIETGVQQGYLTPVSGQSNPGDGSSNSDNSGSAASGAVTDTDNAGLNITPTVNPTQNDSSLDDFLSDLSGVGTDKKDNASTSSDQVAGIDNSTGTNVEDASSITSESEASKNTIIKSTGFDFSWTLAIVTLMGVIMLAGIYVTVRYHYFAQSDE